MMWSFAHKSRKQKSDKLDVFSPEYALNNAFSEAANSSRRGDVNFTKWAMHGPHQPKLQQKK
eukprot:TRINITY_DN3437_c0_g1_i1.p2 TRINITY_DN3437_c0_g1~~TRINITY_DN3437_c0_g1_i1.p2  ORF type:complete len:62 (-),score=11.50 TRINITY_DN3437_c0_g1_i1:42-227(-)